MSSNDSFWLATAAAAPVIALAAIVVLPDTGSMVKRNRTWYKDALKKKPDPDSAPVEKDARGMVYDSTPIEEQYRRISILVILWYVRVVWWTTLINLFAQSALLGVSLWALAYGRDEMPPWIAIFLAVAGIMLIAYSTVIAGAYRNIREEEEKSASGPEKV